MYDNLTSKYGSEKVNEWLGNMMNSKLLCIQANPLKISRNQLWEILKKRERIDAKKSENSPYGIIIPPSEKNLQEMREFKDGFFEICDEGTQLLGLRVKADAGEKVLDLSSSAGSRALTYGPYMKVFLNVI